MTKFTNTAPGARSIRMKDGSVTLVDAGATISVDGEVAYVHRDIVKGDGAKAKGSEGDNQRLADLEAENAALKAKLAALDGDGNGDPGGSKPQDPPALSGKNKAELLAIAEAEGVEIEDGATNADIVTAIELAREEKAKA